MFLKFVTNHSIFDHLIYVFDKDYLVKPKQSTFPNVKIIFFLVKNLSYTHVSSVLIVHCKIAESFIIKT